jgi:hypothetical protein
MFRYSLALLLILTPTAAAADLVITPLVTLGTFLTSGTVAAALVNLGLSVLLSFLAQSLTPRPNQKRQLSVSTSRPPKRFYYGNVRTYGTPTWRVRGNVLYGFMVLNSRPSAGTNLQLYMDKRRCLSTDATAFTADVFDFSGSGAVLDNIEDFSYRRLGREGAPRVWIGRGDQTGPPAQIRAEVPQLFGASDAMKGVTVMWLRIAFGRSKEASRWRAAPPDFEVQMDWSRLWDPRDEDQDPDDPDTWTYSNNQALCLLDGLRQNPIRQYPLRQIHLPSFIEAADVADEPVPLYYASVAQSLWPSAPLTEPRYTVNGLLVWSALEIADQLAPIAQAGAGELVAIGGQVGYAAGEYRAPLLTVSDIIESGGIDYQVLKPGRDLPRFVKGGYVSPGRDWQEAELEPLEVQGAAGGVDDDGILEVLMLFVTSATQAMRVQQIIARQLARQKSLAVTLWPEAVNLTAGATLEMALPAPFSRINGEWTVLAANPSVWVPEIGDEGSEIAIRVPVNLRQNDAAIWAWNPATDEQDIRADIFVPLRPPLPPPTNLTVTTGDGVSTPTQARLRIDFDIEPRADLYQIEIRADSNEYVTLTTTEANSGIFVDAVLGVRYAVRVSSVQIRFFTGVTIISEPAEVTDIFAEFGAQAAPVFEGMVIGGGPIARQP